MSHDKSTKAPRFAKRSFGQNFLVDEGYVQRIIEAAHLSGEDPVIEIGPGRGALTRRLVEKAGRVVAIELDAELIPAVENELKGNENFEIIHADVLRSDFSSLANGGKVKVVANLPYNISTAVLQHLIEQRHLISEMVLMLQREVVDRIIAKPGNSERGYLTVITETFLMVEKLFDVPPSAFKPSPKVWSSVVRLTPKTEAIITADLEHDFQRLVSAGFRQKRKTILNNLRATSTGSKIPDPSMLLNSAEIGPMRRAETLSIEEWKRLIMAYTSSSDT